MKRKKIGISLLVAGLVAGSFLAGSLLFNDGGAASSGPETGLGNIVTPTATAKPAEAKVTATATPKVVVTSTATPTAAAGNPGSESNGSGGSSGGPSGNGGGSGGAVIIPATETPAPPVVTPEPPVVTPEPPEITPEPPVVTPEPPVVTPEAPEVTPEAPEVTPEPEVNEAPFVVESTPGDGTEKQAVSTDITIVFSEPMDQASAEAAFSVKPAVAGAFSWDPAGEVMTFNPDSSFAYNAEVEWKVAAFAQDAEGLSMGQEYSGSFFVLRQETFTLYSLDARDGYAGFAGGALVGPPVPLVPVINANADTLLVGQQTRGFLSFDLSALPASTKQILGAELMIHQVDHSASAYGPSTGSLWVTSVPYETLDIADYNAPALQLCWPACADVSYMLADSAANGWKYGDVSKFVQRDWENSKGDIDAEVAFPGGERLTQLRLQFQKENINFPGDWAKFHAGEAGNASPRLLVTVIY